MQTRVSRHNYEDDEVISSSRSQKNEKLYSQDYDKKKINVPKISNGRELDEEEFQKIINQSQTRSMKKITQEDIEAFEKKQLEENTNTEKVYDINSVLENAKNNRKETDEEKYKVPKFEEYSDESNDEDLLSDLMGGDDTIPALTSRNATVIENSDIENTETGTRIDNSFYSKSIKFKRKDFMDNDYDVDNDDIEKEEKRSTSQVILTVVIVVLLLIAIVLGILVLSKIKF